MSAELETDQEPGTPHPRHRLTIAGHLEEEQAFADALAGLRMHHAWLISGPKGVGKATLAYRVVRRALGAASQGERPLDAVDADPIVRRVAARSHPDLFVVRRSLNERGKPRREIVADDARALSGFFSLKSSEGGRRVAVVDSVDELNRHGANALLKILEEPPPGALLLLIAHRDGAVLPTIRSRCRRLMLRAQPDAIVRAALAAEGVNDPDSGLLEMAAGRPGRALVYQAAGASQVRAALRKNLAGFGRAGAQTVLAAAFDKAGGTPAQRLDLFIEIVQEWIRQGLGAAHGVDPATRADPALVSRLGADPDQPTTWAHAWERLSELRAEADALDLDPQHALVRIASILDQSISARS